MLPTVWTGSSPPIDSLNPRPIGAAPSFAQPFGGALGIDYRNRQIEQAAAVVHKTGTSVSNARLCSNTPVTAIDSRSHFARKPAKVSA